MNKRGDITITILVIGVFMVCTAAIFSLYFSGTIVRDTSLGVDTMEEMNSYIDKYEFGAPYTKFKKDPTKIQTMDAAKRQVLHLNKTKGDVIVFYVNYKINQIP
jgi:hypothetical protein